MKKRLHFLPAVWGGKANGNEQGYDANATGYARFSLSDVTNWPKHAVYSFVVLPLILGAFPSNEPGTQRIAAMERSILIQATPDKVWQQLHDVRDITAQMR